MANHLYSLANCYNKLNQYSDAADIYKMLVKIKPSAVYWNNFAVALESYGSFTNVLSYYKNALSDEYEKDSIIVSNFIRYITERRLFSTAKKFRLRNHEYNYILKTIVEFAVMCVDCHEITAFKLIDDFTISEGCKDYANYFIVKSIFDKTNELSNKHVIRALLLALVSKIYNIKIRLQYKPRNDNIGHYTRIENLKDLVKREETHLRLYNVQYMNDPSEGNVFYNLIEEASKKKIFNNKLDSGRKSINDSNTYLGSFSKNIDSLPLWIQYGNDGTGCCLVFEDNFFDKDEPITDPEQLGVTISSDTNGSETVATKYVLYMVEYVSSLNDCKYKDILKSIGNIFSQLSDECSRNEACSNIMTDAMNILDQARFLFKGSDYTHEQELRIIKWSAEPKCDEGLRSREIPFLYIDLEKPIRLKEVLLGPKVSKPTDVAPYLYYTDKVDNVTQSSIKYQ